VSSLHVSDFDSTVDALDQFTNLLELTEVHEASTNAELSDSEEDLALLEVSENPSYTLAYPPITYAAHAAGGFIHPFSNVNPLSAPWAGFAPVAGPAFPSAAAIGATPMSAYFAGALHPMAHVGANPLGINTALYPAAFHFPGGDAAKGGYNVHGLNAGNVFGGFHPGLSADLTSLGGKAGAGGDAAGGGEAAAEGGEESFMESSAESGQSISHSAYPLASESHDPANIDADAANVAYGLFPAPTPESSHHFVRSNMAMIGPHKLQFEGVGSNEIDDAFPAFVEIGAASESDSEVAAEDAIDADVAALLEGAAESDSDASDMTEAEFETIDPLDMETNMIQMTDDGGEAAGANPSYTLPYPPVLPGHYSPLFNPYTNVNPLSTPFANYAAQPGGHPSVAAAAAAQAGTFAAVNGQIAGAGNGYPYYPYNAAAGVGFGGVPFSGYGGWIHPQNLNSASVGENADAASLGQFLEIATEQSAEAGECVNCSY
jgi:hypothetical protein